MNTTILLPGKCSSSCKFCFWNETTNTTNDYLIKLEKNLKYLDNNNLLNEISISGGEPTESEYFESVINILKKYNRKVVLNTNGMYLEKYIDIISDVVTNVNLSRHHYNEINNSNVFNNTLLPYKYKIKNIAYKLEKYGIDLSINCVVDQKFVNMEFIDAFVMFCKDVYAVSLVLRKNVFESSLDQISIEKYLGIVKNFSSCPVCVTRSYKYKGFDIHCKSSYNEPSKHINYVYEHIIQQDGSLTTDWKGNNKVNLDYIVNKPCIKQIKPIKPFIDIDNLEFNKDVISKMKETSKTTNINDNTSCSGSSCGTIKNTPQVNNTSCSGSSCGTIKNTPRVNSTSCSGSSCGSSRYY